MRIECTTTFLDDRERFEAGDVFTVDDAKAAYFIKHGWAKQVGDETPADQPQPAEPVTLDVQGVKHKQKGVTHG